MFVYWLLTFQNMAKSYIFLYIYSKSRETLVRHDYGNPQNNERILFKWSKYLDFLLGISKKG